MAVLEQLKNIFKRPRAAMPSDSSLSMSAPQSSVYHSDDDLKSGQTQYGEVDSALGASGSLSAVNAPDAESDLVGLPLLGKKTVAQHQRLLSIVLGLSLVLLIVLVALGWSKAERTDQQLNAVGQSLIQSQRLAKSVSQALVGDANAFPDVAQSAQILVQSVRGLQAGNAELKLAALGADYSATLDKAMPLVARAEKSATTLMAQKKMLTDIASAQRLINRQSAELFDIAEAISVMKQQQNASVAEIVAAGQLVMLTQRIGKSSSDLLTLEGVNPKAVFLLGKDLNLFQETAAGLLNGSAALRLPAAGDPQVREKLTTLLKLFQETGAQGAVILDGLQGLVAAREAQIAVLTDSEVLRKDLEELHATLLAQTGLGAIALITLAAVVLLALLGAAGLLYVQLLGSRQRQATAEGQQHDAERLEREAKRVNAANQAAILRLMNELQAVAEGDLTQEATVTEDITGAIADSINYTVEELRSLVGNVQNTASRVAQTTTEVDMTSTELLAASNEQLHEIRETGRSVVDMAARINQVSTRAQESADVARQSLQAADVGLKAVQNAIGGMNAIRDQIQDTSKRIKRLGESSQEIGEITELISDITEQTNVLALNAAIQAASAGDAGRGFSVVAEEVQRLAERSADATRQIAALVKAIQTDTQDAVGAMERSTQGVVAGAKLSDNAGAALAEIDQVSRRLAELIEQISDSTLREANLANEVAGNIEHIFAVTEQTGEGTRTTAAQVRELSRMAEDLRQSVARFRIA